MRQCFSPQQFWRYCANVAESVFYACQQVTKHEFAEPASRLITALYNLTFRSLGASLYVQTGHSSYSLFAQATLRGWAS